MTTCALIYSNMALAVDDNSDTLDRAVAAPELTLEQRKDHFDPYVGDDISYDSNLYRQAPGVDLATLPGIGPNPSGEDYLNTATAGLDAEWLTGKRQSIDLDLRADDNRYFRNTDLDNISSSDRLIWNWALGGVMLGQVGADYSRFLAGFANTGIYSRTMVDQTEYFAGARYQVGPRWALFGGLLNRKFDLTTSQFNDFNAKLVEFGAEYRTNAANRVGFDYRYTDARYPNAIVVSGSSFDPDYREDRARLLVTYALSEKLIVDANAGYLRRYYPSNAIGDFSGETWRVSLPWQPTPKTLLVATVWRNLQADLTAQTDYFVVDGAKLSPLWIASAKVSFSPSISREKHNYIGSNPGVVVPQARRDTLTAETGSIIYTPTKVITLTVSAAHEVRDSNMPQYHYNDERGDVDITFKF